LDKQSKFKPKLIGFMCNWCCYAGADLCGVSRLQYSPYIRIIRVMCSGRVDMTFVIKSFSYGADGVFIGGCWPADCHYVTEGNYDALAMTHILKFILNHIQVNPSRLRLEWVSASEGNRFAEVMNDFANTVIALGPLGNGPGETKEGLDKRLKAAEGLVPYVRLVERERLRAGVRSQEAIDGFFQLPDTKRLMEELIGEKLKEAQISLALKERARTLQELSRDLALSPSNLSRYMNNLSLKGIVRFDPQQKAYALA
jgi:coenzyme F420-reducing hydrogenase delta subunit